MIKTLLIINSILYIICYFNTNIRIKYSCISRQIVLLPFELIETLYEFIKKIKENKKKNNNNNFDKFDSI